MLPSHAHLRGVEACMYRGHVIEVREHMGRLQTSTVCMRELHQRSSTTHGLEGSMCVCAHAYRLLAGSIMQFKVHGWTILHSGAVWVAASFVNTNDAVHIQKSNIQQQSNVV